MIIEVARKADFAYASTGKDAESVAYAMFRSQVLSLPLKFNGKKLTYQSLGGDTFSFYADYSQSPKVNGIRVDYAPAKVFDSPFIQSQWNSGIVTIRKGKRKLVLDFETTR